jgi:hypothetical protein
MPRYKLGFRNRSASERIAISERFIKNVGKLPVSKRRLVRLAALGEALAAATGTRAEYLSAKTALRAARERYGAAVKQLCQEVTRDAVGLSVSVQQNDAEYLVAGLELAAPHRAVGPVPAPLSVRVERGSEPGAAKVRWDCPLRRCLYRVQMTTDPRAASGWRDVATTTKRRVLLEGLRSGVWQWLRVRGANAHGQGPWSQAVRVLPE